MLFESQTGCGWMLSRNDLWLKKSGEWNNNNDVSTCARSTLPRNQLLLILTIDCVLHVAPGNGKTMLTVFCWVYRAVVKHC